ncbi:hypothetical protein ERO13_D10G125900v2 [Gossypium hirsutum]|uniref:Myb-like domain-containing protein n=1 Tax=Gossypium hirsutum TaxID=3635 RepID=A0A1U8KDR5_GOSHI|nr:uncharacterized protein LOC107914640 [Gossypium hirsutum]KAG4125889.1 hypothetical protein ERO13_D10G125900v2 [Gossypium hirsutum]
MANPPGNHQQEANQASSFNGAHLNNGNPVPETSGSGMKHNPGISLDWTLEEQAILDDGLKKYASEPSIIRYAKIALQLQNKTVRDVALRCRWMTKKENSKRRKEEHNIARKSKDKKERVADPTAKPTQFAARPNLSPYAPPMIPMDYDDGIPYRAIGGVTGELLEQNAHAFNQISANLAAFQIQENIGLLCQTRDNILKIMNELNDIPDVMKQMQVLPVKLNDELASTILPPSSHPMLS